MYACSERLVAACEMYFQCLTCFAYDILAHHFLVKPPQKLAKLAKALATLYSCVQMASILDLDKNTAALILQQLAPSDLGRLSCVSRWLRKVCQDPALWEYFCKTRWTTLTPDLIPNKGEQAAHESAKLPSTWFYTY